MHMSFRIRPSRTILNIIHYENKYEPNKPDMKCIRVRFICRKFVQYTTISVGAIRNPYKKYSKHVADS